MVFCDSPFIRDKKEEKIMKIVFLDRDGVINKFPGNGNYVTKVKDFHFLPGSLEGIRRLTEAGFTIFVISNQAGVGKGVFSHNKLQLITKKMMNGVEKAGGQISGVFYSTSRSDEGSPYRKPNIGSIQTALKSINKNMRLAKKSFFVGDTVTDVVTGKNAGCKTIFVLSGRSDRARLHEKKIKPDFIAANLLDASKIITNGYSKRNQVL